ncbi:unnamed protein product [Rotaria sordida]|uniref:F-box domain-containing protein n=2 Tax=Rotaria sordida TaxID=392033 RepID=A0A814KD67_9BILA|nr:unnamed protein product [Rotaria sordida]
MNKSNINNLNILDLPDEILLIIFNKLKTVDALYSLVDVNERFHRLVFNSLHIRNIDTTNMVIISYYDRRFSIENNILSKICEKILPRIHHQLTELIVEQNSMKSILLTGNYPQVDSLSLVNFQKEILFQYLTGNSILHLLTQQIQHLNIDISYDPTLKSSKILSCIFAFILSTCKQLINLNFCQLFYDRKSSICIYKFPLTSCISSTLIKLKVNVATFDDCLYLLDGRLKHLSTLIINVKRISFSLSDNKKKLPELKCFSLNSMEDTLYYDDQIIPLLHRMINLKELTLFLSVLTTSWTYIDGIQLHDQILIYMPQLNKFTFSIITTGVNDGKNIKIDLPSNKDIQRSFIGKGYGQVGSFVYNRKKYNVGTSHVYSLPYQFEYFFRLNNSFQGDIFDTVQCITMIDGRPFEYNLFKRISQCFPLLKELSVINYAPQKTKQHSSILIIFPHLILLNLVKAHVDYAEQFLYDKNTHLSALLDLYIEYKSLVMITNNFTNDTICRNCTKIKKLHTNSFCRTQNFHHYFPLL